MSARMSLVAGWLLSLAGTVAGLTAAAGGQDFRVDTEVFIGEAAEPALETLTIFADGMIFDFLLTEPREIAILDLQRGRLTLLDESRRLKTGLGTQNLMELARELEAQAVQRKDSLLAFAARPDFQQSQEQIDHNGRSMTKLQLSSKLLQYAAIGEQPPNPQAAGLYRHFADWYARLNAIRAGGLPPGARLALNAALAERGLLPHEITRTITRPGPLAKAEQVKSRHLPNWTLSVEDRKRIDQAGTFIATFKAVTFEEYCRPVQNPAPARQAKR